MVSDYAYRLRRFLWCFGIAEVLSSGDSGVMILGWCGGNMSDPITSFNSPQRYANDGSIQIQQSSPVCVLRYQWCYGGINGVRCGVTSWIR